MRQDGLDPPRLEMLGGPLFFEILELDAVALEDELKLFSLDLLVLLRLELEPGDGVALGEMIFDRDDHHSAIPWAAHLGRRRRDILLNSYQHIAVPDASMRKLVLTSRQRHFLSRTSVDHPAS